MITFKQYLTEKAMNRGVYADVLKRLGGQALLGFEIEVFIQKGSSSHQESGARETAYLRTDDILSMNTLQSVFSIHKETLADIKSEFNEWYESVEKDFVDDKYDEYMDDDEVEAKGANQAERSARAQALKLFDKSKYNFQTWILTKFKNTTMLMHHYSLTPTYGWADQNLEYVYTEARTEGGPQANWNPTAQHVAKELSLVIGTKVKVDVSANSKGTKEYWQITQDTSITDSDNNGYEDPEFGGVGLEIISPPTPATTAIAELKIVLKKLAALGATTNETTGIHVNISVPELVKNLDPLKLVLFMGDEHILRKFNRITNAFSRAQTQQIISFIDAHGDLPKSAYELEDMAREALKTSGKYSSVNLNNLSKGYLEFRALGGTDYHKKIDQIEETIGRWLTVVELACDPEAQRKEYQKKLHKLLNRTDTVVAQMAGTKPKIPK